MTPRRLLGLFISKIVLRLLTRGFQISVQKVAFLRLQGICVLVPSSSLVIKVEEVNLAPNFILRRRFVQSVATSPKFFVLFLR
jgi:hypothetical protein